MPTEGEKRPRKGDGRSRREKSAERLCCPFSNKCQFMNLHTDNSSEQLRAKAGVNLDGATYMSILQASSR